jgi:hypothetical protein
LSQRRAAAVSALVPGAQAMSEFASCCVVSAVKHDETKNWTLSKLLRTRFVGKFQAVRSLPQGPDTVRVIVVSPSALHKAHLTGC